MKAGLTILSCLALALGQMRAEAVTFTNSPSAISNQYAGSITLQIGGLTNGETVVAQKFLDVNSNGIVDAADLLIQQFQLTDNQAAPLIGGATNIAIPYDSNPAASNITASINLQGGGVEQAFVGRYAWVVSSPGGRFGAITNFMSVTNSPFGQMFTGQVLSNSTPVPYALVMLGRPGSSLSPVAGAVANASGTYSLKAAAGIYKLIAFKNGFISDVGNAPIVTLATNTSVTTNLFLLAANATISGRLVDSTNSAIGLPGILLAAKSTNNLYGLSSTDTNGNFVLPAATSPGQWSFGQEQLALGLHGYTGLNNQATVFTGTGSVSGVTIAVPKATAMFYGMVTNGQGAPLPGVSIQGQNLSGGTGLYQAQAMTDQNGNYALGVVATNWDAEVDIGSSLQRYAGYVVSQTPYSYNSGGGGTNLATGMAVPLNFTGLPGTNQISGTLTDAVGNPIANVQINAGGQVNGIGPQFNVNSSFTDTNGHYAISVVNGLWSVNLNCCTCCTGFGGLPVIYQCPGGQTVIVSNANATVNFLAFSATPDVASFSMAKQQNFVQSGPGSITAATNPPFLMQFVVNESSPGSVVSASVTVPGSTTLTLTNTGNNSFQLQSNFNSQAALDAAFPTGNYSFNLGPRQDCARSIAVNLPANNYPNAAQISNFAAAQTIAAGSNFVLQWSAFGGGTSRDFIYLEIDDTSGNDVFSTPGYLVPGWLNGTNTSVVVPAGALLPGQVYQGQLQFVRVSSLDTNSYPGAWGASGFISQTSFALGTATNAPLPLTITTVYQFDSPNDGANPSAGLLLGRDGNFYGTTVNGGTAGSGVIFKMFANGVVTNLYSFTSGNDGAYPYAALAQASNGLLYGTASYGGSGFSGTIFSITTNGGLNPLYSFTGGTDGSTPITALASASNGVFYGTTPGENGGGVASGTVFKLNAANAAVTIYPFTGGTDGDDPEGDLALGRDRNFYGTTSSGGLYTNGTVFKVTTNGALTTLFSFNGTNGSVPLAGLLRGSDGSFYGTTWSGGGSADAGTVFKITTNGVFSTLHFFNGNNDGANPLADLVQGTDGNLYGTTALGGLYGEGTVFLVTTNGLFTNLFSFSGINGSQPLSSLVQAPDGSFFGTTSEGGASDNGTIFRLVLSSANPPDLRPVSVSAPALVVSSQPNPAITVSWSVTNQGAGPARGGWWDRVWISTNGSLDNLSVNAGDFFAAQTVPAGGSYTQTNTVALPLSSGGPFSVFVQADVYNQIYESSKTNNISSPANGTLILNPPDLAPVFFVAPAVVSNEANPVITVAWGVTNRGGGVATGGWSDGVWFSTNGVLDSQSVDIGDFFITNTVPPGGNYIVTNSVILPLSAGANYSLFLQVNLYGDIFESNTMNNVSGPVPGLFVLTHNFLTFQIGSTVLRAGQSGSVPLTQSAGSGVNGLTVGVGCAGDRLTNVQVGNLGADICASAVSQATNSLTVSLWTCDGQPLNGSVRLADLTFNTVSNQSSAFVPLTAGILAATNSSGSVITRQSAQNGRVTVIGPQPLLESYLGTNKQRGLTLYGKPGSSYQLESTTNLADPSSWKPAWRVPMTNLSISFQPIDPAQPRLFFRGYEFFASPPILDIAGFANRALSLLLYGRPGGTNTVFSATNLASPITWTTQQNVVLTNSFQFLSPIPATNPMMYFRAR